MITDTGDGVQYYAPTLASSNVTTLPPRIIDLKLHVFPSSPGDLAYFQFDYIIMQFVYGSDANELNPPSQFFIESKDLETGKTRGYVMNADQLPYQYWQRSIEDKNLDIIQGKIDPLPLGKSVFNARVRITPLNAKGKGFSSIFFIPSENLLFIENVNQELNPASLVLGKFWDLFSVTPEERYNRPKQMHIYLNVSDDDIKKDKELLGTDDYKYTALGDSKQINQQMFRWSVSESFTKLNQYDEFVDMSPREIEFINYLMDAINDVIFADTSFRGLGFNDPAVFKIAVENPRDHDDSIIIYVMRNTRWKM